MTDDEIKQGIVVLGKKYLKIEDLSAYKDFSELPDVTSVEFLEFIFQMEKRFKIRIPDDSFEDLVNLDAAVKIIAGRLSEAASA